MFGATREDPGTVGRAGMAGGRSDRHASRQIATAAIELCAGRSWCPGVDRRRGYPRAEEVETSKNSCSGRQRAIWRRGST
jgi:hypothetical protein